MKPHDFQQTAIADIIERLKMIPVGRRLLYSSPTGTGKSVVALAVKEQIPDSLLITPRLEIVAGMLEKEGVPDVDQMSEDQLVAEALERRISTPIRTRNMLAEGRFPYRPTCVIVDEGHHSLADSYGELEAYLPSARWVDLTATPYRGTQKSTAEFLGRYDNEYQSIIDIETAAARGFLSIPELTLWPLVDDDTVEIEGGEFKARQCGNRCIDRVDDLVERMRSLHLGDRWERSTLVSVPTTAAAKLVAERLNEAGLPAEYVLQDTSRCERVSIFRRSIACEIALVQISVVSEGVDLPFRRLVDFRPLMSPVAFMQMVGRITRPVRPGEAPPQYFVTNRNAERHCYLFEGLVPPAKITEAQAMFGKPSKRAGMRIVGLEGLSRFKSVEVPFASGETGVMYQLHAFDGFVKTEYAAICHPRYIDPIYASRQSVRKETAPAEGDTVQPVEYDWGTWQRIEEIPDVSGYASAPQKRVSDKQKAWWEKSARRCGLNPKIEPDTKNFAALPIFNEIPFPRHWR